MSLKFDCNGMTYEIIEVSEDVLKDDYMKDHPKEVKEEIYLFGRTDYTKHTITIDQGLNEQEKIKTLKHELCHCWMHNTANGHQEEYSEEQICEIVACSNDFINGVVEAYLKK